MFFDAGCCWLPTAVCSMISRFSDMSHVQSSIVGNDAEFVSERECGCVDTRDMLSSTPELCAACAMHSLTGRADGSTRSDRGNGLDMAGLEGRVRSTPQQISSKYNVGYWWKGI